MVDTDLVYPVIFGVNVLERLKTHIDLENRHIKIRIEDKTLDFNYSETENRCITTIGYIGIEKEYIRVKIRDENGIIEHRPES